MSNKWRQDFGLVIEDEEVEIGEIDKEIKEMAFKLRIGCI
jgi:hypothetical protein